MSETKHASSLWQVVETIELQMGDCVLSGAQIWSDHMRVAFVERQNMGAEAARDCANNIVTSVNARPQVEELVKLIFYNAGQAKGDGSAAKPGLANLQPMDWDLVVAKAREVEAALGGKAE